MPIGTLRQFIYSLNGAQFLLYTAFGLFLTILAPFGTDAVRPTWYRSIYWFSMIYGGALIFIVTSAIWAKILKHEGSYAFSFSMLRLVVTGSVPITVMVANLNAVFGIGTASVAMPVLYFYVLTINAAVTISSYSLRQAHALRSALAKAESKARAIHAASENRPDDTPTTAFASRLKVQLRSAKLVSISSDDHYLDVVTSAGREQIRCSMAEAASELASIDGRVIQQGIREMERPTFHRRRSETPARCTLHARTRRL